MSRLSIDRGEIETHRRKKGAILRGKNVVRGKGRVRRMDQSSVARVACLPISGLTFFIAGFGLDGGAMAGCRDRRHF